MRISNFRFPRCCCCHGDNLNRRQCQTVSSQENNRIRIIPQRGDCFFLSRSLKITQNWVCQNRTFLLERVIKGAFVFSKMRRIGRYFQFRCQKTCSFLLLVPDISPIYRCFGSPRKPCSFSWFDIIKSDAFAKCGGFACLLLPDICKYRRYLQCRAGFWGYEVRMKFFYPQCLIFEF